MRVRLGTARSKRQLSSSLCSRLALDLADEGVGCVPPDRRYPASDGVEACGAGRVEGHQHATLDIVRDGYARWRETLLSEVGLGGPGSCPVEEMPLRWLCFPDIHMLQVQESGFDDGESLYV